MSTRIMAVILMFGAGLLVGCGEDGPEESTGQAPPEPATLQGRLEIGTAVEGDVVPIARDSEAPAAAWTFDARTGRLDELPPPTTDWLVKPLALSSSSWVVITSRTCPEPPVLEDPGYVCPGGERRGPFVLFAYDIDAGRWITHEIPDDDPQNPFRPAQMIVGDTAILSRQSFEDGTSELHSLDLETEGAQPTLTGDLIIAECDTTQPPSIFFSDPEPGVVRVLGAGDVRARTVELPQGESPDTIDGVSAGPACSSARDIILLPGDPRPDGTGFSYSVYRLDDAPTEVVTGDGAPSKVVAGSTWFAIIDADATVVYDRDGTAIREIDEPPRDTVATESALVFLDYERTADATTLTLRPELVR